MPSTTAEVTFIAGEYWPTTTGKDRWKARSNDGREFGVWDEAVYKAVMEHLSQPLQCEIGSKQADSGTWWNTLYAIPSLGVAAARKQDGQQGGAVPLGTALDLSAIVDVLNRIAVALEANLTMRMEARMRELTADDPTPGVDPGPDEPPAA